MADSLSIIAGIAGLLPVAKEGFILIRDVFVSHRKSRFYLGRVELQTVILQAWEDICIDSKGLPDQKLKDFAAANPLLARGILQQLVLLLRTLTDPEKLKVKYGLVVERSGAIQRREDLAIEMKYASRYLYAIDSHFSVKDLAIFDEGRASHMALFRKIRFALSGRDEDIEDLIGRLDEFNRHMQLFSASLTSDVVDLRVLELAVKDIKADADLTTRLEEAASYESKHSVDPGVKEKNDDLAKFANFSLAIKSATADISHRKIFSRRDFSFDSPYEISPHSTLARLFDYPTKYQSRLVLVEWVSVSRTTPLKQTLDETKVTWYVLHAEKPEKMLLPASIGLIHDESDPRIIGIVYQLPSHIRGNLPTKPVMGRDMGMRLVRSPSTLATERLPTSLRQLIQSKDGKTLDLGVRFQLAKQFLNGIHMMHAAGWIHRNIRSDNILFFPSADRNGDPDPTALDYARPVLFGFHDARLEVQFTTDPPSRAHPEGLKPILKNAIRKPQPLTRPAVLDCYAHPDRRLTAAAGALYRRQYDLYGVGCVLLELGLWETLDNVCGREIAARAYRVAEGTAVEDVWGDAETVRNAAKGLDSITGPIYADVTRQCLSLSPVNGDIVEFERELAGMLAQIAA